MGKAAQQWDWFLWLGQISKISVQHSGLVSQAKGWCFLPIFSSCDCQVSTLRVRGFLCVHVHCWVTRECCVSLCFCFLGPGSSGGTSGSLQERNERVRKTPPSKEVSPNDLDAWTTHNHLSLTAFSRCNGEENDTYEKCTRTEMQKWKCFIEKQNKIILTLQRPKNTKAKTYRKEKGKLWNSYTTSNGMGWREDIFSNLCHAVSPWNNNEELCMSCILINVRLEHRNSNEPTELDRCCDRIP